MSRILTVGNMYPPHHQGGYELAWKSWVEHLAGAGHEVAVLTTDHREPGAGSPPADEAPADVARELRWYWRDHAWPRLSGFGRLALERHNARVFDRLVERFRPDAVAWWAMGGMSLSLLARARPLPAVAVVCDDWLVYAPKVDQWLRAFATRPRWRRPVAIATGIPTSVELSECARFLFLSDSLRRRAARDDPRFEAGEIAHRGPDLEHFTPAPAPEWRWRLLYAGRIDPRKGIDVAIRALAELPPEATLTIAGGGGDERHLAELRDQASELGLTDRVSFPELSREQLQTAYAEADVVVFPVLWDEPWGLVPLEAMVVGTPVVATGMGGSGEYLEPRRNCLIHEAGSPSSLAAGVRQLAADPGLRELLRAGGLETARGLSAERFNRQIEAAILELIG